MDEQDWLAQRFETYRTHLRAVAYRMLGSISEAEDALAAPRSLSRVSSHSSRPMSQGEQDEDWDAEPMKAGRLPP